jgi:hypothetical protein
MVPYAGYVVFGIAVPLAAWFIYSHRLQLMGRPLVKGRRASQ